MKTRPLAVAALALLLCACPTPSQPDGGGPAPLITSLAPVSGPVDGGTSVTVNGANFASGAAVRFGEVAAATVTVESGTRLVATAPAVSAPATVGVTVVNPDGRSGTLPSAFTYVPAATARPVQEAVLLNPAETADASGSATVSVEISGAVQVAGVTAGASRGLGVRAEVGYAAQPSEPPGGGDFTWVPATYRSDADGPAAGDLLRDVYAGAVSLPGATTAARTWSLAVRFSTDDGATWTLGDRDGAANGVTRAQLATVTLSLPSVTWCKLGGEVVEAPPMVSLRGTTPGPVVYGQVYEAGVTTLPDAPIDLTGQLGVGAPGSEPSTWTWADATFNRDSGNGANDEFMATLPNPGVGTWRFAYRFRRGAGAWSYCDADGLAVDGFTEAQAGTLTVQDQTSPFLQACRLQTVSASSLASGSPLTVTARALVSGSPSTVGATPGLVVEVGVGPQGDNASTSALWGWRGAAFALDVGTAGEDEFSATVYPAYTGNRAVAARASLDGLTWTYCDLNGSEVGGYEVTQQYDVQVAPHTDFPWCNLQWPPSSPGGVLAYGRVYQAGVTPDPAAGITAQLGLGAEPQDPGLAWRWEPATFNTVVGNNNEYQATLPGDAGLRYAFRFTQDGGSFCYGDLDGSNNGFSGGANLGEVTAP